ncbi:unnamed protein product [Ambrosiozyma monospora]|uniref:Unnamed protein product n=1 Tax=Ambrosiozyma monospora TaxID=43982 RepID=A0ACB5T287_AMBMO|nr:unnamed protein product [Ambrosiozyma monospora]
MIIDHHQRALKILTNFTQKNDNIKLVSQIAETLSGVADSQVYYINPTLTQTKSANFEYLSSNDAFSFIDSPFPTILNINSHDLLTSLPSLSTGVSKDKKFIINVAVLNGDYSIVTAFKDLGFNLLISSNAKESYDFAIVSYLLAKVSNQSVIHFYTPSKESVTPYATNSVVELYQSFDLKASEDELESAFAHLKPVAGKLYSEFELLNPSGWLKSQSFEQVFVLLGVNSTFTDFLQNQSHGVVSIKVYRPFKVSKLQTLLSGLNFKVLQLVEQSSINLQFQPLFLDLIDVLPNLVGAGKKIVTSQLLSVDSSNAAHIVNTLVSNGKIEKPVQNLALGKPFGSTSSASTSSAAAEPKVDECYLKILQQIEPNLNILNYLSSNPSPEYSYGKFLYDESQRAELIKLVEARLSSYSGKLNDLLTQWLIKAKESKETFDATELIQQLENFSSGVASPVLRLKEYFHLKSTWIVGSDNWAFDTGLTAFHELLKSGNKRLKLLIIDSDASVNRKQGKKNLGLYAMNYGNAYVSSVAIYSSYTQSLTSILEANAFHDGPAIVLAYLPKSENHLDMLKETKIAVDTGYWPLIAKFLG